MAGIGERIRRARERRGLTQTALARALPLSSSYLSLIESGKRVPRPQVVEVIAAQLGCAAEYLLTGKGGGESAEIGVELQFAELALQSGDASTARARFEDVLRRIAEGGADEHRDVALWGRAHAAERMGDLDIALGDLEHLAAQDELDPAVSRTTVFLGLCRTLYQLGDLARAIEMGERALQQAVSDPSADQDEAAELSSMLVYCYLERGDYALARVRAEQLIERAERVGSLRSRAAAYWNAGLAAEARGDLRLAQRHTQRALALYSESDLARHLASVRVDCAVVLLRSPEPDYGRAQALLVEALRDLHEIGGPVDVAKAEAELARCQLISGYPDAALTTARTALTRLDASAPLERANVLLVCAYAKLAGGELGAALAESEQVTAALRQCQPNRQTAAIWRELGRLLMRIDQQGAATEAYDRAVTAAGIPRDCLFDAMTARDRAHS